LYCLAYGKYCDFCGADFKLRLWYRLSMDVVEVTFEDLWLPGRRRRDRVRAPEVVDAAEFGRTRLGIEFDAKQVAVLRSNAKRGILNCSRQWGKSTVGAAMAVHRAYSRAGSLVLVASPTERQSAEFLRKAAEMVRRLGIRPRGDGRNAISIELPNRSRIIGLPGTEATVRGFSAVSLVIIDEAAWVRDEMYAALRPMLAVGDGDLWLMSTPCGQRGFFYEVWQGTGEDWFRVSVQGTECPRISADFLARERAGLGSTKFSQEYLCEFTGDGTEYFDRLLVEAALDESYTEWKL
jgi:hypothetical protein